MCNIQYSSPVIMQIKVELGANKGFFAQCILKYCQKTPKKCLPKSGVGKKMARKKQYRVEN